MLDRECENTLAKWLTKSSRKPLVIRGARQVGKSTLVRKFCREKNLDLFEVNLERNLRLVDLFRDFEIDALLDEIEIICGKCGARGEKSVVFLDEIQAIPEAIPALRYFHEDYPDLKVVSAGSLLEFILSEHSFSMPVGRVEYLFVNPMTFPEFLKASKEEFLLEHVNAYEPGRSFSKTAHDKLVALLKDYFLVGGMPEAVQFQVDGADWSEVSGVHSSIIETYLDDFAKYAKGKALHILHKVFNYVGTAPGRKIKYSNIDGDSPARDVKHAVDLLIKAKIIFPVYHSSASGIPLLAGVNDKVYKLFFLDVGLMNRLSKTTGISIERLKEIDFINKGDIAEQFIAQNFLASISVNEAPMLHYWLREGRSNNAEVDFVLQDNDAILPVEVKAGALGAMKSLHRFVYEKGVTHALRFDLSLPSSHKVNTRIATPSGGVEVEYDLLSLPLYMVGAAQ
ncbi:MAG: ATP-binding protein [Kiritimatiellaeota bacterium]|nr:ATP-binding protein [Kiritimatiellota bacterium]